MRTKDWRLTVWAQWNGTSLRPNWAVDAGIELYDHRTLEGETRNVADHQLEIVARLKAKIEKRFKNK